MIVFPLTISVLSNVDGLVYDAVVNVRILLGVIQGTFSLDPYGGRFKLRLFWSQIYNKPLVENEEKPEKKIKKPQPKRGSPRKLLAPIRRLLSDLTRVIRLRKLDIDLTAGISDPYVLGLMFGVAYPVVEMMKLLLPPLSFSLTPDFAGEKFESKLDSLISLRIILLIVPLVRFFISKGFREYRRP